MFQLFLVAYNARGLRDIVMILKLFLNAKGKSFLFQCNFDVREIRPNNVFVNEVCSAWAHFVFKEPLGDYGHQIIWNNSRIKVNNKTIFHKHLYDHNVIYINDFLDDNRRILSYNCFVRKFSVVAFPFTMYYGIIHAIPAHWRQGLVNEVFDPDHCQDYEGIFSVPNMSRVIYRQIISTVCTVPTSCFKWNLNFSDIVDRWNIIFRIPFTSVHKSKIQYFQFRFLHRILGTNSLLHRMNLAENPSCTFCENHDETIDHLFWECGVTSGFILDVEQMFLGRQFTIKLDRNNINNLQKILIGIL